VAISAAAGSEAADLSADHADEHEAAVETEYWRLLAEKAQTQAARLEARIEALASHHEALVAELREALQCERVRTDALAAELAEARKGWLERLLEVVRRK
jgi:hypothetical protein